MPAPGHICARFLGSCLAASCCCTPDCLQPLQLSELFRPGHRLQPQTLSTHLLQALQGRRRCSRRGPHMIRLGCTCRPHRSPASLGHGPSTPPCTCGRLLAGTCMYACTQPAASGACLSGKVCCCWHGAPAFLPQERGCWQLQLAAGCSPPEALFEEVCHGPCAGQVQLINLRQQLPLATCMCQHKATQ